MKLTYFANGPRFFILVILGIFQIGVHAEESNEIIESTGSTSFLQMLSSDELESLRNDLQITTDPACREALKDSLVTFLKGIRQSNGIRLPRQDDGDDGDEDGDGGGAGGGGGILGGAGGGLLNGVDLPPVVPQVLGALTQAFTGLNQVVNASSGQTSIPGLLFSGFSNLVGQFTGQTQATPVTPPPYFQTPPGGLLPASQLRPPPPPGGFPNKVYPIAGQQIPGQQRPPIPGGRPGPGQPWAPEGVLPQQGQGQPRPPPRTRSPSRRPKPSGPPKSSLWNIYKSFGPSVGSGSGGLTDFQLAHPEGFHSELLQSISSSLNKNRGTPDKLSSSNSNSNSNSASSGFNNEPSSDIQQPQYPTFQQPQYPTFQQPQRPQPPPRAPEPPRPPRPSLLLQQRPSERPSILIQKIVTAPITLPPEILSAFPTQEATLGPVVVQTKPEMEHGSLNQNDVFGSSNSGSNGQPEYSVTNSPEDESDEGNNSQEESFNNNNNNIFNSNIFQGSYGPNQFPSSAGSKFQGQSQSQPQPTLPAKQSEIIATSSPEPIRTPPPKHESHLEQVKSTPAPETSTSSEKLMTNRFTSWVLNAMPTLASQAGNSNSPPKSKRPVIINNMYYPDLETALTDKPRRRRKSTTTQAPALESDYYEDEEVDQASQRDAAI